MKKITLLSLVLMGLLLGLCAHAGAEVPLDAEHFPDDAFRAYLQEEIDADGDGALSDDEINGTTRISCYERDIRELTGIEYFTRLAWLECFGNGIRALDVTGMPDLELLNCERNRLSALDISHNPKLARLHCGGNRLESLDVSANTALEMLDCGNQPIDALALEGLL